MNLNITYSNPEARVSSKKGNPIPIKAYALQGRQFSHGQSVPIKNGTLFVVFAGFKVTWDDPTVVGIISPVANAQFPSIQVINAGAIIKHNSQEDIYVIMTSATDDLSLIEHGSTLAELVFVNLAKVD